MKARLLLVLACLICLSGCCSFYGSCSGGSCRDSDSCLSSSDECDSVSSRVVVTHNSCNEYYGDDTDCT